MSKPKEGPRLRPWPTRQARTKACDDFCAHLAAGYSIDSFPEADRKTIRYYAEQFPDDFPAHRLEEAARRGLLVWEQIGKQGARGELPKFNASAWSLTMKNRAGWRDRSELETWNVLGGVGEAAELDALKPRSCEQIALAVMELFSRGDRAVDDDNSRNTRGDHREDGAAQARRPAEEAG